MALRISKRIASSWAASSGVARESSASRSMNGLRHVGHESFYTIFTSNISDLGHSIQFLTRVIHSLMLKK